MKHPALGSGGAADNSRTDQYSRQGRTVPYNFSPLITTEIFGTHF